MAASLRVLTRRRLLDGMVKHVLSGSLAGSRDGIGKDCQRSYLVLIADQWTLQLLERVCQMHDLLSEGIALVECLDSPREAIPLDALYFVAPTMQNMERLVEELTTKPKYRSSHLFFSHRLEDVLLQHMAQNSEAVNRISSFAELNVSVLCYDDRSFQLKDQGDALKQLLDLAPQEADLREAGSCLATVFASLGQEPLVFCAGDRGCERLAREVCQRLEEMETRGGAQWREAASPETCSLLIVDRSVDWAPLLLHDMGYEALMFDLLGQDGASLSESRFTFTDRSDGAARRVVLGEELDELWQLYRHMAMYEVNELVVQEVRDWSTKDSNMRMSRSSVSSGSSVPKMVSSTVSAVQSLPEHKERFRKLQIHMEICERCSQVLASQKLVDLIALEQDLATKGLSAKSEKELLQYLQDPALPVALKLRLLMLCEALGEGGQSLRLEATLPGRSISRLRQWSEVMRKQREAERRLRLRSRARSGSFEEGERERSERSERSPRRARLWRWRPRLAKLLQDLAAGSLDTSQFRCMRNLSRTVGRPPNSSVLIYVVGGVTLPEIRAAHEVTAAMPGVQAYVGGSCLLTPGSFVELWESS